MVIALKTLAIVTVTVVGAFAASSNPAQPHLAKAWTALSSGDGYPGATGRESYLYTDDPQFKEGGLRAHLYDYGSYCKKLTVNQWKPQLIERSYYMKCKAVDCCYEDNDILKKWDLHKSHLLQPVTIKYMGIVNTTALDSQGNNVTVTAERWHESDTLPLGVAHASYDYYISREGDDVITHRIEYGADGVNPGIIVYGDFEVQHNLTKFAAVFDIPPECQQALQCPDEVTADWSSQPKPKQSFRATKTLDLCNHSHESCCPAPGDDPNNCPASARTSDCDAKKSCCCG